MKYYLSVDGGGSKTALLLCDENGRTPHIAHLPGCAYPQLGIPGVLSLLKGGILELLRLAGVAAGDVAGAAFGLPCYGEDSTADGELSKIPAAILPGGTCMVYNDVELGAAGSLALAPGIHMVAGTGAIAFAKNSRGETGRSGGWHEEFADEGSAYWLGNQTLRLFVKQADGRAPKGPLYDVVREALSLSDDMDIVSYFNRELLGSRAKTAKIQLLLEEAAKLSDRSAIELYEWAAHELFITVRSLYERLCFSEESPAVVSYFGGVYRAGEFILTPLRAKISGLGAELRPPILSPVCGGILLAAQSLGVGNLQKLTEQLKKN